MILPSRPAPNFQSYSGTGGGAASTPAPAASAAPAEWGTLVLLSAAYRADNKSSAKNPYLSIYIYNRIYFFDNIIYDIIDDMI